MQLGSRIAVVVCVLLALPAIAQAPRLQAEKQLRHVAAPAVTEIIYDDGEVDDTFWPNPPHTAEFALRFDGTPGSTLVGFTLCLARPSGSPSQGDLAVGVYAADGPGGSPGTPISGYNATATGVETGGNLHPFSISPLAVPSSFYVSVFLDSEVNAFRVCGDSDGIAGNRPIYVASDEGEWTAFRTIGLAGAAATKTFIIRAAVDSPSTGGCVRDSETACLQGSRFEVTVSWNNASDTGTGKLMAFGGQRTENDESAFYSFQSPTNFEMGVKVLNACIPLFDDKFWVFISGLTNQGWVVTVRDTLTGAVKTYSNPNGQLSETFADTSAFDCS